MRRVDGATAHLERHVGAGRADAALGRSPASSFASMIFRASGTSRVSASTAASHSSIARIESSTKETSPSSGVCPSQNTWLSAVPCSRMSRSRIEYLR